MLERHGLVTRIDRPSGSEDFRNSTTRFWPCWRMSTPTWLLGRSTMTRPELSVLLAWTKIVLAEELVDSDLPDDPYLREDLLAYFPSRMKPDLEAAIEDHPLRRQIIANKRAVSKAALPAAA